jgi:hypothetical protein
LKWKIDFHVNFFHNTANQHQSLQGLHQKRPNVAINVNETMIPTKIYNFCLAPNITIKQQRKDEQKRLRILHQLHTQ